MDVYSGHWLSDARLNWEYTGGWYWETPSLELFYPAYTLGEPYEGDWHGFVWHHELP